MQRSSEMTDDRKNGAASSSDYVDERDHRAYEERRNAQEREGQRLTRNMMNRDEQAAKLKKKADEQEAKLKKKAEEQRARRAAKAKAKADAIAKAVAAATPV